MGYQPLLPDLLSSGASVLTVNFADDSHLLVTFALRRLMKREANDPPNDDDRTIGAFLVELPSGKVVAKTEWRVHDRGQYLWPIGHGRFLLRVHDQLKMLQPMAAATPEETFHEFPFLSVDRRMVAILLSAEDDLLTIETTERPHPGEDVAQPHFGPDGVQIQTAPVQLNFYRLTESGPPANKLVVVSAGVLLSKVAIALPVTTSGFLDVLEGGRDRWLFNFDSHAGKVSELAEFSTTCYPRTTFVSRSEFIAFGCRGGTDKQDIAGFNLNGDAMWQQNFFDIQIAPTFAFAPEAGRFALGRTIVSGTGDIADLASVAQATSQEVRVYQTYSGKVLLRTDCTPVVRAGQNYALSPDGLKLALFREITIQHAATKIEEAYVTRTAAIEVYALPALTGKDEAAVKEARGFAPADTGVRIDLAMQKLSRSTPAPGSDSVAVSSAKPAPAPASITGTPIDTAAADQQPTPEQNGPASGDPDPTTTPRTPPTLYAPGEKPQGKQK
jgi:hypothetical protein